MTALSRAKKRNQIKKLIRTRDFQKLRELTRDQPDTAFVVGARVFERDDAKRWKATEALGQVVAELAHSDLEKIRALIRRILWLMNDESGGIAWNGPETIAEILENAPELLDEYGRIVASFIDESPFETGSCYAIARLSPKAPGQFTHVIDQLEQSLDVNDPARKAYALLALSTLKPKKARREAQKFIESTEQIQQYERNSGTITFVTLGSIARQVAGIESKAA